MGVVPLALTDVGQAQQHGSDLRLRVGELAMMMVKFELETRSPLMSALIVAVCVFLAVVGVLVTVGCLVAIRLEIVGLGAPRDTDPRADYIAILIFGAAAAILIPAVLSFFLLKTGQRMIVMLAALATILLAIAVFGMGW